MEGLKKANLLILLIFAIIFLLYIGSGFLIPFTFGVFCTALMAPLSDLLEKGPFNRVFSSLISTLIIFIVVGGALYLIINQASLFLGDLPIIRQHIQNFITAVQKQISSLSGLSVEEQNRVLENRYFTIASTLESYLISFIQNIFDTALNFLLVLVYLFLMLLGREKIMEFLLLYTKPENKDNTRLILKKTGKVVHHYLLGRAKIMAILATMYIITFIIFGIPYALLLTIFGALITIIPYIGPFISGVLPIAFAIIFGFPFYDVLVFSFVVLVIQLIESYVMEPIILGREVALSPLMIIIAIIIGGMIWGIAGMILFVPIFAVFKIIADHHNSLRPVGYLMGTRSKISEYYRNIEKMARE